jgi:hypothetical protein
MNMHKVSGRGGEPLPVYGCVLKGVRPLVVLRATFETPLPRSKVGYFRNQQDGADGSVR